MRTATKKIRLDTKKNRILFFHGVVVQLDSTAGFHLADVRGSSDQPYQFMAKKTKKVKKEQFRDVFGSLFTVTGRVDGFWRDMYSIKNAADGPDGQIYLGDGVSIYPSKNGVEMD